jgi:CubicO group peptidase (beta-lactamase class C family)
MTARDVRRCDGIRAGGTTEGKRRLWRRLKIAALFLSLPGLVVCTTKETEKDEPFSYQPLVLADWNVSTPEAQGLDSGLVLSAYQRALTLTNIYSLLIVKNGYLVAEKYFHGQAHDIANSTASVTKSVVSSLAGLALRENILAGLDQTIVGFFPEVDWPALDPRKSQITIRQMLQMRSGFPWEEFSGHLNELFSSRNWIPFIAEFPLSADPGTQFGYSNLAAHLMGIILARAADMSLSSFAQTRLFDPLNIRPGYWPTDASGYSYGSGDLALTPRDMAKFGLLYLNAGMFNGSQIVPSAWISESLLPSSFNTYKEAVSPDLNGKILSYFDALDYGYLWWSSKAGEHPFHFAWGHGGQLIVLVHDLNMVVVTSANSLPGQFGDTAWQKTKVIMEMVGEFIASI